VITSLALGLFAVLWLYSGIWTLVDLDGARETAERLGYPGWTQAWTGALKIAGVAVILWGRWGTLSGLAFAGFFYDLALAGGAHALRGESDVALVLVALAVTGGAFWADRRRRAGSRTG
jgi:hypothetical protein